MSDTSSAANQLLNPEALKNYTLSHPRQIRRILREIMKKRVVLSAFIKCGAESFITAIIDADEEELLLDVSPDNDLNTRVVAENTLTCQAVVDGVRVQFEVMGIRKTKAQNEDVFITSLPETLIRLQRRDGFRLSVPRRAVKLELTPAEAQADKAPCIDVAVEDISTTGVGFLIECDDIEEGQDITAGQTLQQCRLELPDESAEATLDLRVRHVREITNSRGEKLLRVGCEFAEIPSRFETRLQRYMFKLERDHSRFEP